jgi:hypothetical protein
MPSSTDLWEKPLRERQSLRISKKILLYCSVSSHILETTLPQTSLTYRLPSFRIYSDKPVVEPEPEPEPEPVEEVPAPAQEPEPVQSTAFTAGD